MTSILNRVSREETTLAARTIWVNQEKADIAANAIETLVKASAVNLGFLNGKSSRTILGGLFYILGHRFKAVKTQKEIADLLGTSDVSIRESYRSWLNEFPFLFTDVTHITSSRRHRIKEK